MRFFLYRFPKGLGFNFLCASISAIAAFFVSCAVPQLFIGASEPFRYWPILVTVMVAAMWSLIANHEKNLPIGSLLIGVASGMISTLALWP